MFDDLPDRVRPDHHGPPAGLWFTGLVRIGVLVIAALGAYLLGDAQGVSLNYLLLFYVFGLAAGLCFLVALQRKTEITPLLTWAQVLVDVGVVAATVSFTGGPMSFFTFLFVVVILEAGLLLGVAQGFVVATVATLFLGMQAVLPPINAEAASVLTLSYNFLVQGLAFYLTASMGGFWNQRVRWMQQFQREILDNMNNGLLITDRHGIITAQNKAADQVLDLGEGEAVGRPVQEILRVESGAECPVITAVHAQRDFTSYEFQVVTGQGKAKLLGLTTSRIYDAREQLTGIIASFSDLTEVAKMREELQRQDRLAVVGELATGLAHEIRNPVAAIRGAVEELRVNMGSGVIAEKLVEIAIRESDHLNRIIVGFLDFARRPSLRRERFDLRGLVDEVSELVRQQHGDQSGLTVETSYPGEACAISGDRSQIKEVFINIARNAAEAMRGRGTLSATVSSSPGSVEVRFDDEGPGIEPDKVARIFEPFYTTKDSGVGMGLAVCHRIITAHDGTIRATSREGGGASFSIRLPAAPLQE